MKFLLCFGLGIALLSAQEKAWSGTTYFVSPTGNDSAVGSQGAPFLTICHAALIMNAGDSCYIRAGTYRETVRPAYSGTAAKGPIVFSSYAGETVEVTGADAVPSTGWTLDAGSTTVFKISYAKPVQDLFLGGQHLAPARYPAETAYPYDTAAWMPMTVLQPTGTSSNATCGITFAATGLPANACANATVVLLPDTRAWVSYCGKASSSTGTNCVATNLSKEWATSTAAVGTARGYFTGSRGVLAAPGQWYADGAGTLYVWAPNGASPASQNVEARTRTYAFDLSDRNYIQVLGLRVRAAKLNLQDSQNCLVQNCSIRFVTPFQPFSVGFNRDDESDGTPLPPVEYTGIEVSGANNTLNNCYVAESFGDGITLWGTNNVVTNCYVEHTDRSLTDAACISASGTGHQISYNTFRTSGRSVLLHRHLQHGAIHHNEMAEGGVATNDLGITYTFDTDGEGARLSYNWIHDNLASAAYSFGPGIYLDNNSTNNCVDHNVIWNCGGGVYVNGGDKTMQAYNNTMWNVSQAVFGPDTPPDVADVNNLAPAGPFQGSNIHTNQTYDGVFSPFVDPSQGNFQLLPATAPIGAGTAISGITTTTPPNLGAYETTNTWTAGTVMLLPAFTDVRPSNPDRLSVIQVGWTPFIQLTWRNLSTAATALKVYRRDNDTALPIIPAYTLIATLPAGATEYLDTAASPGVNYSYQVRAENAAGQSAGAYGALTTISDGSALRFPATAYDAMSGITNCVTYIGYCDGGDYVKFAGVNLSPGFKGMRASMAVPKGYEGKRVELHLGSPTNAPTATLTTVATGTDWSTYAEEATSWSTSTSGSADVYFVFQGGSGVGNFQWFQLENGNAGNSVYQQPSSVRTQNGMSGGSIGAVGYAGNGGGWISFPNVDFGLGVVGIGLDLAATVPGSIDVYADAATVAAGGTKLGTISTTPTGGATVFQTESASLSSSTAAARGLHALYLVFNDSGLIANVRSYTLAIQAPPNGTSPTTIQATSYSALSGMTDNGTYLGSFDGGDWVRYSGVDFGTCTGSITLSLAAMAIPPVPIEAHVDSLTGPLVGILAPAATGGWGIFQNQAMLLCGVGGTHDLYLKTAPGSPSGAANIASLTINAQRGWTLQAKSFTSQSGSVTTASASIGNLNGGSWVCYKSAWLGIVTSTATFSLAVPASNAGQTIELRLDSPGGTLVGTIHPAATGGWATYASQTVSLAGASGTHDLYLVVPSGAGAANVASITFN